jgi:uncharacterized membrane protein
MTWSPSLDIRFHVVLALVLAGLLVVAHRLARGPGARGLGLFLLRALTLSILVLILLNPIQIRRDLRPGPSPRAVFLLDGSRSMSLEAPIPRSAVAAHMIDQANVLMARDRRPRIETYRFGRALEALAATGLKSVAEPRDDETRLTSALEQLPSRFDDGTPFGVFLFSDGRSTESQGLDQVAEAYRTLEVPIHVFPVGDERVSGDVAIQTIDAPRNAAPGTRVPVRVTLRSRGFDGQRVELQIRRPDAQPAEPLASLPVTLSGGEQAHEMVIETDRARGPLTIEVPALPHEAIAANNIVPFQIAPRPATIRVLYMEGTGSSEARFLKDALEEDPSIRCTTMMVNNMYDQRPILQRVDNPRLGYPTSRQELFEYDVVICSDIARTAFTREQLEWTVELVAQRGGGFAMIGGNVSFGGGGWDQTIWDGMIPIDMSGRGLRRSETFWGPLRVIIPSQAESHPIWRIVDDPVRNRAILDRLPQFYGTNLTKRLKPAGTELGHSDREIPGSGIVTVFSCQSFGRGRSFAMSTDTTADWGADFEKIWGEGDNRYYRKFWRNVVRWLAENSAGTNRRLRTEVDKIIYRPGQPIMITAQAFDEQARPADSYRVVARLQKPGTAGASDSSPRESKADLIASAELTLSLADHTYRGELAAPSAGVILENPGSTLQTMRLELVAQDGQKSVAQTSIDLQLLDDPAEFLDPRPDKERLAQLARASGGQILKSPEELAEILTRQARAADRLVISRRPVWDQAWVWALLLGLLATEWILRRRRGLA